ncbi:hypothetical protein MIZ01_0489 [Sideroxyarcus emersonii]|uniref:Flagellar hook-length control protein-like C-terminal domain-containing protein n=1 Tax=Sideroxyarcus emersonii TaxID=2764705 RepID=A0AAN2BY58_9PROT|nr:flagellar hook-length control protein FliK [Sideroxyarcus emersonii]BCK86723.1 hypothetical protein MIZ01_0489 [Sideroxyarcus emersonii]
MTNLPITLSAQQPAAASKQAANASDNNGDAQNSQPFGDVLARQIGTPATKDAKADDKLPVDALAQLGTDSTSIKKGTADNKKDATDNKKAAAPATETASTLPTDMLAALLPQAMQTAANTSNTTTKSAGTPSDPAAAIAAGSSQDKRAATAVKTDIVAAPQKNAAPQTAGAAPQAKASSFAAALTESVNQPSEKMVANIATHDAIAAQAGAQSNAAATAALQNAAASIAAPLVQPMQATVNTPVGQGKWGDEFSQKVTWIASSGKDQTAELHLNPPQLGPVDVVIKVSGDQATALFTSPHAAVRDVIEQALPRLRDMLADNGIMLGNATVSDQAARDQSQSQSGMQRASASNDNDIRPASLAANSAARVSQISRHNGIVDTFA